MYHAYTKVSIIWWCVIKLYLDQSEHFEALKLRPLFNWGQGVFTSFRVVGGDALFREDHIKRLKDHYEKLFLKSCDIKIADEFDFIKSLGFSGRGRVCLFENDEGKVSSLIELSEFKMRDTLKVKTIKLAVKNYEGLKLPFYAAQFQQKKKLEKNLYNDFLNLDESDFAIELSTSNLFVVTDENHFIFNDHESAFNGIMREKLIDFLKSENLIVKEEKLSLEKIKMARGLYATNSVQCLSFIETLDNVQYVKKDSIIELEKKIEAFLEKNYGTK